MDPLFANVEADPAAAVDALAAAGFRFEPEHAVSRTVLDTYDGRLQREGLRLELLGGRSNTLVLTADGRPPAAQLPIAEAPRFADDLPSGPFRARVGTVTAERALLPLVRIRTRQRRAVLKDRRGKTIASVTLHAAIEVEDKRTATMPLWAVEVHGVVGHEADADRAIGVLESLGLRRGKRDLLGLAARASGVDLAGRRSSPTVPMNPSEPAFDAVRRVLVNLAATIEENHPGTLDDVDPEFLHELRVAVRRTRAVLGEAGRVLPPEARAGYREAFGWLGSVTGPSRDLDVYLLEWPTYIAPLPPDASSALEPVLLQLQSRRATARESLEGALRGDRYRRVMDSWLQWLHDSDSPPPGVDDAVGPVVRRRIRRSQRRLVTRGRAIGPSSPAGMLHDLRKDAKKLRYLVECFGSMFVSGPRRAFVQRLKILQDNLGEHQDTEVHMIQLRALAHELYSDGSIDADALLAMGQLTEHLDRRRAAARAAFVDCFGIYDSKPTRRAFDELLRPLGHL